MSRYRGYRRRHWGSYHVSQREQVTKTFGGIDKDIQKIFFSLSQNSIEGLFKKYGKAHGSSAESYARKTYPKWKNGQTKLSGQTAERLISLIPPYLSEEVRFELIKKLRSHYLPKRNESVSTTPEEWKVDLIPVIEKFLKVSNNFEMPQEVKKKAAWLASGDTDAANKILSSLELEETKIRANYLKIEFQRIQSLVQNLPNAESVNHMIELPQGTICVLIEQPKKSIITKLLGDKSVKKTGQLVSKDELHRALSVQQERGNLLNLTVTELTEEQRKKLTDNVLTARLNLDVSQANADQRFINSTKDMNNTINAVNALEQSSKSDYDVKSSYETASGTTNIHVKKNNNTVIIVVCLLYTSPSPRDS